MLKVFSFGGGVQSTAALVLAAQGRIDYRTFLFCNVGADSENPDTLTYVRDIAKPFAARHGLTFHEVERTRRDGSRETIYGEITRSDNRSIGIPVYMGSGAPGNRSCTIDFKIAVVDKWLKQHTERGAIHAMKEALLRRSALGKLDKEALKRLMGTLNGFFAEQEPLAIVGLGISLDEIQRVKPNMDVNTMAWKVNAHPLIFDVPRPLTRHDCLSIIADAGLPVPPKSSCWFCPYHSTRAWQDLRLTRPDLFEKAVQLETLINERRAMLGKDRVWLSSKLKPLSRVTTDLVQLSLPEQEEMCESGYCFV